MFSRILNSKLLHLAIIIILGLLVYLNSLQGEFIWDDNGLVKENRYIRNWRHTADIFLRNTAAGAGYLECTWRPLQILSYCFDYSLWGLNVIGYHLSNTALHILVALAVYWLSSALFADKNLALITSILFVSHPVHSEAVAYISGRADLLSSLFMLISLILYIRQLKLNSAAPLLFVLMAVSYLLALLSKENALILPALLWLYHYTFKEKIKLGLLSPFLGSIAVYSLLRANQIKITASSLSLILKRIPGFFAAITEYFKLLALPLNLHMEHGNKLFSPGDLKVIFGLLAALSLAVYAFRKIKSNKLFSFSILWFFIALLPTTSIYPVSAFFMAEHWLYFPAIGFFIILSDRLFALYRQKDFRIPAIILIIGLIGFYSFLTVIQNKYWNNHISFYKRTLRYAPDSARVYNNLCRAYIEKGKNIEASLACRKAIEIQPNYVAAYANLGDAYRNLGNISGAISAYDKAVEIDSQSSHTHSLSLAAAYYALGNTLAKRQEKKAVSMYRQAIALNHNFPQAYNNLAAIYADNGQLEQAIALWIKAVGIDPRFATAHFNLAVFYFQQKKYDLAIAHCDKVIKLGSRIDPEFLKLLQPYRK